jgi:murein DD-endopeptidase MepM/ murein hydrolase activator NlpD
MGIYKPRGGISHLGPGNGYARDFALVDEAGNHFTDREKKENHCICGEPVYAAADGEVEFVRDTDPDTEPGENDPRYGGNVITIRHDNGEESLCVHLMQGSSLVRVGDRFRRGQKTAEARCSGRYVDFLHLHFQIDRGFHSMEAKLSGVELWQNGEWIDPGVYVPQQEDLLKADW